MTRSGTYKFETLNAAGGVCCGSNDPDAPRCARCETKPVNGHLRNAELRTPTPANPYTPPDPYEVALAKLRREQGLPPIAPCPFNSPTYDPHGPAPDPYAAGI